MLSRSYATHEAMLDPATVEAADPALTADLVELAPYARAEGQRGDAPLPREFATSSWRGRTGAVRLCRPRDPSWLHSNCDCGEQSNVFECPVEQATATCDVGQFFLLREQFRWVDGVFTFDEFEWDRRDPARERRCTYTVELLPG